MKAVLSTDDALNYILKSLRDAGPAAHGAFGYHFTVVGYACHYVQDVLGKCHADPIENDDTYAVSTAFYDAAWELARRGILRPSVHNSFMQFDAHNATGGGYTLTEIGAEWLADLGNRQLSICAGWGPRHKL